LNLGMIPSFFRIAYLTRYRLAEKGHIIEGVIKPDERFDFCMCNPPFFSDVSETGKNEKVVS
jgi:23S rRNA A1618 N6-methylase RlmF